MFQLNEDVDLEITHHIRKSMTTNHGDLIRLADVNIDVPEMEEVGLFAVPVALPEGDIEWMLIDGACVKLVSKTHIELLVKWIVRTYGDGASLTDCARGFLV